MDKFIPIRPSPMHPYAAQVRRELEKLLRHERHGPYRIVARAREKDEDMLGAIGLHSEAFSR